MKKYRDKYELFKTTARPNSFRRASRLCPGTDHHRAGNVNSYSSLRDYAKNCCAG
jgi:hypothetical protein